MKTKVNYSKMQGRKDDKKFHSVAEFCRIVANDCTTDIYGYFVNFYAAFVADTSNERKHESETTNDFNNRVLRNALQAVKSMPTKELKESTLYKTFSSKNQLFKLVRSIMPAFYDTDNNHKFAKVQKVAFNTSKLSRERLNDMVSTGYKVLTLDIPKENANYPNGKRVEIVTKHFKTENGLFDETLTKGYYYNLLSENRKQRKENFADMKESATFFFDANDNICTLVENDKLNFASLYAFVSEYAQRENFAKVENQQQKEKQRKVLFNLWKANKKLDASVSKTFNALLDFRCKVVAENNNTFIADENKRNLVVANFIKLTTEYKAACQKRFADWKESENGFLQDTANVVRLLTIQPAPKTDAKKASTKKGAAKKGTAKKAA